MVISGTTRSMVGWALRWAAAIVRHVAYVRISNGAIDDGALPPKEHKLKPTTVKLLGGQHIDELHLEEEEPPMDM
jgi:hypothetical protein